MLRESNRFLRCTGQMLPPPRRPPKQARNPGGATVRGVPLVPSSERAQCQTRQLDAAMARGISGKPYPCSVKYD